MRCSDLGPVVRGAALSESLPDPTPTICPRRPARKPRADASRSGTAQQIVGDRQAGQHDGGHGHGSSSSLDRFCRSRQHKLEVVQHPGCETTLAVGEVELPETAETVVEPEAQDRLPTVQEALTPTPQRQGVVRSEATHLADDQARVPGQRLGEGGQGGQVAAREDVPADEVGAPAIGIVALVRDGDGLQGDDAPRGQQAVEGGAERSEVAVARPPRASRSRRCGRSGPRRRASPGRGPPPGRRDRPPPRVSGCSALVPPTASRR